MRISMSECNKSCNRSFLFSIAVIGLIFALFSPLLCANELPHPCSRDQNINEFTILSYHEIAQSSETLDTWYAVKPNDFEAQMVWLIENGFHFISVDDILNYRNKGKKLPPKAVLITFDDGYHSVYANAFPVLKKYKIPSVIALVGSWLFDKESIQFDQQAISRSKFLSQNEIKEMIESGLVEVASHSYLYHKGIMGNPQENMQPAITSRQWLKDKKRYEDEVSYKKRVYEDLLANNIFLEKYTGQKPRVMVWPYGRYNLEAREIAQRLGMTIGLTLDDGSNTKETPLWGLKRILVEGKMTLKDLEYHMRVRNANLTDDDRTTKAAHIDLDYIYDRDSVQQERNLDALVERIRKLGINTVYLQAFADPDANGAADYVYFPNRHIPMRADLFNRVAWQIAKRTQVKRVYAWMPMLAWQLPAKNPVSKQMVVTLQVDKTHLNMGYPRLSPFSASARKVIEEIYEDLSKGAYFDGILFHDDVTLSDFEDDSLYGRAQYKKWGLSSSVMKIRKNHNELEKWTQLKTDYLDDFAMRLASIMRERQPGLRTARNMYAQVALNQYAKEWYAQGIAESIKKYDYTAIMAMPYMEEEANAKEFYKKIVDRVGQEQCGLERLVMEIQVVDWRKNNERLSSQEIGDTISYIYGLGAHHIAYYPDDVHNNHPDPQLLLEVFKKKSIHIHEVLPQTLKIGKEIK